MSELKEINDKLDRLSSDVSQYREEMRTYIAKQNEICGSHRKETEKLTHSVDGNGKAGLKETVQSHEQTIQFSKTLIYIILPIVFTLLVDFLWKILVHAPK